MIVREPPNPPLPRTALLKQKGRLSRLFLVNTSRFLALLLGILLIAGMPLVAFGLGGYCLVENRLALIVRIAGFLVLSCIGLISAKSWLPRRLFQLDEACPGQPTSQAFLDTVSTEMVIAGPRQIWVVPGSVMVLDARISVWNLLLRPRWNLIVGLWLWNGLDLSEFKALVVRTLAPLTAGRAGRFRAYRILESLCNGQDAIDLLAKSRTPRRGRGLARLWRGIHRGVNYPLVRLGRLFLWLNPSDVLEDDRVAVRLVGSDALVHAVFHADFSTAVLREVNQLLGTAAREGCVPRDFYPFKSDGIELLRQAHNDYTLGELPTFRRPNAGKYTDIFEAGSRYNSDFWAGFPGGYEREENAKTDFVPAEYDDRPASDLIDEPQAYRERLTRQHALTIWGAIPDHTPVPNEVAQRWCQTDSGEEDAVYGGLYDDGRWIDLDGPTEREAALVSEEWTDYRLVGTARKLYAGVAPVVNRWKVADKALRKLMRKTLNRPIDRDRIQVEAFRVEIAKADRWLRVIDRRIWTVHVLMASRLANIALHEELLELYSLVLKIQGFAADTAEMSDRLTTFIRRLEKFDHAPPDHLLTRIRAEFRQAWEELDLVLCDAQTFEHSRLESWLGPCTLDEFLLSRSIIVPKSRSLERGADLLSRWNEIARKANWLYRQILHSLLETQAKILGEFMEQTGITLSQFDGQLDEEIDDDPLLIDESPRENLDQM